MASLIRFRMTQDILTNPNLYPTLVNFKASEVPKCPITFKKFKVDSKKIKADGTEKKIQATILLGNQECKHYCSKEALEEWLKLFPQTFELFGKQITIKARCPSCRKVLDKTQITDLSDEEVLKMRVPSSDDPSKEKESFPTLQTIASEPAISYTSLSNPSNKNLLNVVKIAAIVSVSVALIFISIRALQQL